MSAMWSERHRPKMLSECVLEHLDDHSRKLLQEQSRHLSSPMFCCMVLQALESRRSRGFCVTRSLHGELFQRITIRKIGC